MSTALLTELSGHAFQLHLKVMFFACTASLLPSLHMVAITPPLQYVLGLLLREDCLHQRGHCRPINWIELEGNYVKTIGFGKNEKRKYEKISIPDGAQFRNPRVCASSTLLTLEV